MIIRIAVIDNEKEYLDQIVSVASNYLKSVNMEGEIKGYTQPRELLWNLEDGNSYDIYLIDVEMPGINGIELAQQIQMNQLHPYLIFISSYIEYSIECYEYQTFRYLLKDNIEDKLPKALAAVFSQLRQVEKRYYMIESYSKIIQIDYEDIYYLSIDGKYTYFYTRRGTFRERLPLTKVYEKLQSDEFIYVDKGKIVNLKHVLELDNRSVVLRDRTILHVSTPQLQKVKKAISHYWRKHL